MAEINEAYLRDLKFYFEKFKEYDTSLLNEDYNDSVDSLVNELDTFIEHYEWLSEAYSDAVEECDALNKTLDGLDEEIREFTQLIRSGAFSENKE